MVKYMVNIYGKYVLNMYDHFLFQKMNDKY